MFKIIFTSCVPLNSQILLVILNNARYWKNWGFALDFLMVIIPDFFNVTYAFDM